MQSCRHHIGRPHRQWDELLFEMRQVQLTVGAAADMLEMLERVMSRLHERVLRCTGLGQLQSYKLGQHAASMAF